MLKQKNLNLSLIIGSIGVIYGDIGTSPLYAVKSCFTLGNLEINNSNIIGLISVFIFTLFFVVSIKYVSLILNINIKGEGGILVLSNLCAKLHPKYKSLIINLGIIGLAFFFTDAVITPPLSILSALEGLSLNSNILGNYIEIFSITIIVLLLYLQKNGTSFIGKFFGPIMIIWFITIAALGVYNILKAPMILKAFNPYYGIYFLYSNGIKSFFILSGVMLVITGVEAIYADLGHFGLKPIRWSWNFFVFPSLLLNYLGQGSLLIHSPESISNPFYLMAPSQFVYIVVVIATFAAIIASQSVISGLFSLAKQAMDLNYLPKMQVLHTSKNYLGQIYIPIINYILGFFACLSVLQFHNSDNLVVLYGLSISCIMLITTLFVIFLYQAPDFSIQTSLFSTKNYNATINIVIKETYHIILILLLLLDIVFVVANTTKIFKGALYGLFVSAILCILIKKYSLAFKKP